MGGTVTNRNIRVLWLVFAIALTALAVAPTASADMTRPTWTVGDYWLYNIRQDSIFIITTGTLRMTVAGTDPVVVEGVTYPSWRLDTISNLTFSGIFAGWMNMSGPSWYRMSDLSLVKQDFTGNYTISGFPPNVVTAVTEWNPPSDIQWPLTNGNTWTTSGWMNTTATLGGMPSWSNTTYVSTRRVQPTETVTVPAGTFSTTPLNDTAPNGQFNVSAWSPTAGNYVRFLSFDGFGTLLQSTQLASYQYQAGDAAAPSITGVSATPAAPIAGVDTVTIAATVTDDVAVAAVFVNVTQPDATSQNRTMTAGAGNRWTDAKVWDQVGVHTFVIWASDSSGKWATSPPGTFTTVAPDTTAPTITHTPPTGPFYPDSTIRIEATVTDDDSVQEVRIDYTDVGGARHNVTMALASGSTYAYTIPAQNATGTIEYRIYAFDPSGNAKLTQEYTVTVQARPEPLNIVLIGGIGIVIIVIIAIVAALLVSRRRKRAAPPSPPQTSAPPP